MEFVILWLCLVRITGHRIFSFLTFPIEYRLLHAFVQLISSERLRGREKSATVEMSVSTTFKVQSTVKTIIFPFVIRNFLLKYSFQNLYVVMFVHVYAHMIIYCEKVLSYIKIFIYRASHVYVRRGALTDFIKRKSIR